MKVEVKFVPETDDKIPESARKSMSVETHSRRGDMFNIDKADNVMESTTATTFNVPDGGRLVITMPQAVNEVVYDRDQGAAIKTANQQNTDRVADKPTGTSADTRTAPPTQQSVPPQTPAPNPVPPVSRVTGNTGVLGQTTTPQPNPTENAKALQQSAPRPPGEKAPLPGSPVGSPPAGNEGKDNK